MRLQMRMRNQDIYSDDLDEESFNAAGWFGSPWVAADIRFESTPIRNLSAHRHETFNDNPVESSVMFIIILTGEKFEIWQKNM